MLPNDVQTGDSSGDDISRIPQKPCPKHISMNVSDKHGKWKATTELHREIFPKDLFIGGNNNYSDN